MLAYTLFEILNASDLKLSYRYLKVRERLPDDNYRPIRLQKWADELWQRRLKRPAFPLTRDEEAYFIIPADIDLRGKDLTFRDVPNMLYHVDPTGEVIKVDLSAASVQELNLVARVLERSFSDLLNRRGSGFWRDTWTRFFYVSPTNEANPDDRVNAFRGFSFAVTSLEGGRLFLAVDVVTRYAACMSLAEYRAYGREDVLESHCCVPFKDRYAFLRDNGPVKFRCFYAGDTGKSISEYYLEDLGQTVYEYYRSRYPEIARSLCPDDEAVFVKRKKADDLSPVPAPASRLFPIFTTEHREMRRCSVCPSMAPEERIALIRQFLETVTGAQYRNVELDVRKDALTQEDGYFLVPRLEFGGRHMLDIDDLRESDADYPVHEWGWAKIQALYEHRPFYAEPFPATYLLYPNSLPRHLRERLRKKMMEEVKLQSGQDFRFTRQHEYIPDRNGQDLLRLTRDLASKNRRALLVCVLNKGQSEVVYPQFKEACEQLFSQCLEEQKVVEICNRRSKLRNLCLGILTAEGIKPWVLADSLHHDLHIGIDVLPPDVIYNYLFGRGGRQMLQGVGKTGGREAIKRRPIREEFVRKIRWIANQDFTPKTIVVHRDGRLWKSEREGIDEAIRFLVEEGTLPKTVRYGVAEIRKSHFPIRVFDVVGDADGTVSYRNPFPGCYLILDKQRAVLTTTGKPKEWDRDERGRTAIPLLIYMEHNPGDLSIRDVTEDVFRLSQLNWAAPEHDISVPVTIRWADELLRERYLAEED